MRNARLVQVGLALGILGVALLEASTGCKEKPAPPSPPPAAPATTPATKPATKPHTKPASRAATGPSTYLDVLRLANPSLADVEPLNSPVLLREAARFQLTDPVYLDEQGHLWITRTDVQSTEQTLSAMVSAQPEVEHVIRDRALFVWWVPDASGEWIAHVVTSASSSGGGQVLISPTRRQPLGSRSDYRWQTARTWIEGDSQRMVVPTSDGVSVFTLRGPREPVREVHQNLTKLGDSGTAAADEGAEKRKNAGEGTGVTSRPASSPATSSSSKPTTAAVEEKSAAADHEPPLFLFAPRGIIAWIPPGKDSPGSAGAAWFVDGAWKVLTPAAGWPDHLVHIIPLRDGSVTQLIASGEGISITFTTLDAAVEIDRKALAKLIDQLGDDDPEKREKAKPAIRDFGAGALPILREIKRDDVSPQAWTSIRILIRDLAKPMLGGIGVKGEHLRLVKRLRDGGAVFFTPDGISVADPQNEEPLQIIPAWISARPGRSVEPLPPLLIAELKVTDPRLDVVSGHWVLSDPINGLRLVVEGSLFRKLLRKEHMEYTHLIGLDRRGRWLLRKPADADAPPERSVTTLIIDPTFVDPTPRLPVYAFDVPEGDVGWDKEGWGAVRQGTLERRLMEGDWAALLDGDTIHSNVPPTAEPPVPPPTVAPAATTKPSSAPSTGPTTNPATTQAATRPAPISPERLAALGTLLLTDAKGNRYFNGVSALIIVDFDGRETTWPLPAEVQGSSDQPVTLLVPKNGRLFLFNQKGKIHRFKPTPGAAQPFAFEATFTKDIPSDTPRRIWLDPAGRIIMAMEHKLVALFPNGFIPQSIRERMTTTDDDED